MTDTAMRTSRCAETDGIVSLCVPHAKMMLCLLRLRLALWPCPGSRCPSVPRSIRGDRCAPRRADAGAHSPPGVPPGRNPNARAACACVCPRLCDPLCLPCLRLALWPCPGSRCPSVPSSIRGDRCVPPRVHTAPQGVPLGQNTSERTHSARRRASQCRQLRRGVSADASWISCVP